MNEWINEWRKNLKEICAYVLIDWTPPKNTKASYFEFAELIMALLNIEIYCIFSIFQKKKNICVAYRKILMFYISKPNKNTFHQNIILCNNVNMSVWSHMNELIYTTSQEIFALIV